MLHQWLSILWIKTTLNATTTPSKATAPWSFQQRLPKRACREYTCYLINKMSCCTSGRRNSVNAPSSLNHIKFHLFQKGKCGSFALCLQPRDVTNEKASSFPAERCIHSTCQEVVEVARKSTAKSPSSTGGRHHKCTIISAQSSSTSIVNNVHIHSRQAPHTPSAGKGFSVLMLPCFLFMISWNTLGKSGTFQKLLYCHCQLWLSPRTLSSKKRKCPTAVKGEQTALARTSWV